MKYTLSVFQYIKGVIAMDLEKEIEQLQKIMDEQDKLFERLGRKPNKIEYDENGYIMVDMHDKRQMQLWSG